MKIAVTADVHYGHKDMSVTQLENIRDTVLETVEPDLFVIAGDLGETPHHIYKALEVLEPACRERVYIPGNHDLWKFLACTSEDLLNLYLPKGAARSGYKWMEGRIDSGDVSVIYTPAWHDMSLRAPYWPKEWSDDDFKNEYWENFSDGKRINQNPVDLCNKQLEAFSKNLGAVPKTTKAVMIVSHYPIFAESYCPYTPNATYNPSPAHRMMVENCKLSDAFFYSPRFGELVKLFSAKRPDVKILSVSGHTHRHFDMMITPEIRAFNSSADYGRPTVIMAYWEDDCPTWSVYEGMAISRTKIEIDNGAQNS